MRRYNIFSAILLILSIIDFALAAPVLVRENRQASVDVVHIPKDVIDVLGKRVSVEGGENLATVTLDYFKTLGKPAGSSDAHASSSLVPAEPDHGPTSIGQTPGPNPASSTANPGLLNEPSSSSSTVSSVIGVQGNTPALSQSYEGGNEFLDVPLDTQPLTQYGSVHELTGAHGPLPNLPNPNLKPQTDSEINSNYRTGLEGHPPVVPTGPAGAAASQIESGQAHEDHVLQVLEPIPGSSADWKAIENPPPPKSSWKSGINWKYWANPLNLMDPLTPEAKLALSKPSNPKPSTKSGVNWKYWVNPLNLMDPLTPEGRLRLASPRPLNTRPSSNTGPSNTGSSNTGSSNPGSSNPISSNPGPSNPLPLSPRPLRIQEPKIDDQSSSTDLPATNSLPAADSQPMDPQAALYAVKGKAKESRRVSDTTRDVDNAAQREFQPVEVSLDPVQR